MVIAAREDIAEFRLLRAHGWTRGVAAGGQKLLATSDGIDPRYRFEGWGFNVRPTELNAAFGLRQLERLATMNQHRLENYLHIRSVVSEHCPGIAFPTLAPQGEPNPFAVAFICPPGWRSQLQEHLEHAGVETRSLVAGNLARHPAARRLGIRSEHLPGADRLHFDGMYVGLHATSNSLSEADFAAEAIVSAYSSVESRLS